MCLSSIPVSELAYKILAKGGNVEATTPDWPELRLDLVVLAAHVHHKSIQSTGRNGSDRSRE
eukprot:5280529-Prorocentrum_lima.AAC.1